MSLHIKSPVGTPDIDIGSVRVKPSTATKTITQNGIYTASTDGVDGYSAVTVNCEQPDPTYVQTGLKYNFNEHLRVTPRDGFSLSNGITLEMCFEMHSNETSIARFFSDDYNSTELALSFATSDGTKYVELNVNGSWVAEAGSNTFAIPTESLVTLSAVIAQNTWKLYLNGVLQVQGNCTLQSSVDDICVGMFRPDNRELTDTDIYSARIYNRALSDSEIVANRAIDVSKYTEV